MKPVQAGPPSYYAHVPQRKPKRRSFVEVVVAFARPRAACLISTGAHVTLLLLLALIVVAGDSASSMQVFSGTEGGTEGELQILPVDLADANAAAEERLESLTQLPSDTWQETLVDNLAATFDGESAALAAPEDDSFSASSKPTGSRSSNQTSPVAEGGIPLHVGMTSGRSGAGRGLLLQKYGGNEKTEAAVKKGIEWLMRQQATDGSWSFLGPYSGPATFGENQIAATSMALLAVLGAGHTHKQGDYPKQVEKALRWLVSQQAKNGDLGEGTPRHHGQYSHAQATLAISEAYAMTDDSWLRPYCEKAVAFALRSQGPEGGWRYEPRGDSDTSVTGWFLIALISARSAKIEVPETHLRRITGWLNRVDRDDGATYSYTETRKSSPSMTAEGLLCRMYLGWERSRPALEIGASRLLKSAPFYGAKTNYYYWYYATQVMHHIGGRSWEKWNAAMREQLPGLQLRVEPEMGSWPPGDDRFDRVGGRLYCTCTALYCLEVYYRHLPIYDSPWQAGAKQANAGPASKVQ